jgi:hypothetical protein
MSTLFVNVECDFMLVCVGMLMHICHSCKVFLRIIFMSLLMLLNVLMFILLVCLFFLAVWDPIL